MFSSVWTEINDRKLLSGLKSYENYDDLISFDGKYGK